MEAEERKSFFERHPWRGALLFFALIGAVGIFIVRTVGERPHYRNADWAFVTERPGQGDFLFGSPYSKQRVSINVRVRADLPDGNPGFGMTAELMVRATGEILSRGITGPPGGHILLPVPAELDPVLFKGGIEALLRIPGEAPRVEIVLPPDHGACVANFDLKSRSAERFLVAGRVTGQRGARAEDVLVMLELCDVDPALPTTIGATAKTAADGRFVIHGAQISGRFRVKAYGDGVAARTDEALDPGATGIELALAPTGSVAGTCSVDPASTVANASLVLVAAGAPAAAVLHRIQSVPKGPPTAFQLDGIAPGAYDLVVLADGAERARIAGVIVKSGAPADDPRLRGLRID